MDDARQLLKLYDPKLGVPVLERMYAEDCRIYTPDHPDGMFAIIVDNVDMYAVGHLFGWYVKVCNPCYLLINFNIQIIQALILRDEWILILQSFGFELLEYTLQYQLPRLEECWWDHVRHSYNTMLSMPVLFQWILDFVICNGLGIFLGMKTCKYLSMKVCCNL